ncbi:HMG domain-containing protein 4a isoform X2 [Callorhinchus milii]|nr:HMG domain-containing protein 4a isoform X2 [Callorhinchus milii]
MAYDDALKKKEDCLVGEIGIEEVGLAAGRSQREKKRSYKDFLREEEEIDAEVRKSVKKKTKETEDFLSGADSHKKKKKLHLTGDDIFCRELSPMEPVRKKKRSESHHSDTAMGLLKAITSPALSKSSKKTEKSSFSPFSSSSHTAFPTDSRKEHRKRSGGADSEDAGQEGEGHKAKKLKPLFLNTEGGSARDGEGLRVKLLLSPKDKSSTDDEAFSFAATSSLKKPSKKASREEQGTFPKAQSVKKKHRAEARVSESFESEASFYSEVHGSGLAEYQFSGLETLDSASSSGAELEAGELVIDDSYREIKKKKKAKKSKKKKDKDREKHKDKKHSKSKRGSGLSPGEVKPSVVTFPPLQPTVVTPYTIPTPPPPIFHTDSHSEKKKKKEEKEKEKFDPKPEKKKKIMTAYQVFCKEYRVNIIAEHPAIGKKDFGELSKKLAEVWKQLPEKEKLAWKQKCLYLQHKQNKAEATTIKRKLTDPSDTAITKSTKSTKPKGLQRRHISSQFRRRTISGGFLVDTEGSHHSSPSGITSPHRKSSHSSGSGAAAHSVSPIKMPEAEPIDAAAHLQLLGESLSLIGHRLQETEGMVAVSGSLSVLLDSIICALGPLACLTAQVHHLNGCSKDVLANTLDNIAYIMPGL